MTQKHIKTPIILATIAILFGSSFTSAFAAPKKQTPTATPNQVESSTNEDEDSKQDHSAGKESHERFVNQGAEEAPISPGEHQEAAKKPALTLRQKALKRAITQLGNGESPPGSNNQKYSRYFGKDAEYWCADFVSWSFDTVGKGNKKLPWKNPSSVSSIIAWGKNGHEVRTPKPGDIFTMQGKGVSHTGLVRKVNGKTFFTVEGNTSNKVRSLKRSVDLSGLRFFRVDRDK